MNCFLAAFTLLQGEPFSHAMHLWNARSKFHIDRYFVRFFVFMLDATEGKQRAVVWKASPGEFNITWIHFLELSFLFCIVCYNYQFFYLPENCLWTLFLRVRTTISCYVACIFLSHWFCVATLAICFPWYLHREEPMLPGLKYSCPVVLCLTALL